MSTRILADPVTVLGGGAWGTALAVHLGRLNHTVRLWARDHELVRDLATRRENRRYLPGIDLPADIEPTASLTEAVAGVACVVVAVPSHGLREVMHRAAPRLDRDTVIVSATKGLEVGTLRRMSEVIVEELEEDWPVTVLSGPSFAAELAQGLPTAVSVAGLSDVTVQAVQQAFHSRHFRLYGTQDVVGVEMGGAMKNVIAIAAGVVESLALGHNALAALITRGLAEISRLACAVGGRRETLAGLSGLGDLVLTCTGALSRNRQVGIELGRGRPLDEILKSLSAVAEGVRTTHAALELGAKCSVELPIAAEMAAVLDGRRAPREAVDALMLRRQRSEVEASAESS